ncbi:MAG: hypothetical protein KDA27_07040 [Candidatus Eisenbacteria bacterium]|uniref:Uncharacterized protein n=1 Tax=Eiseniibacteriota bacterium TaxID=2212470 RepID=A0A956SCM8_UNCEI|nr:hypothetical protein [Candidatus Eisenbacteria bacterium]
MTQIAFNFVVALLFTALAAAVDITVFRDRDRWRFRRRQLVSVLMSAWVIGSAWNFAFGNPSLGWIPYLTPFFVASWVGYGLCLFGAWRRGPVLEDEQPTHRVESELERAAGIVVSSYLVVLLLAVLAVLLGRSVLGVAA